MDVYNITVVEKRAIEFYSNLYPFQEYQSQYECYNDGRKKTPLFILPIFNRYLLSAYYVLVIQK